MARKLKIVWSEKAAQFPSSGRIVPEYAREDLREKIHKSYRIVYRVREDCIEIVTIFHATRLTQNAIDERLI